MDEIDTRLRRRIASVPAPDNYYVGPAGAFESLPRDVLAFHKQHDLSNDHPAAHHRFVLVACLDGPARVILDNHVCPLARRQAVLVFPFQGHHYMRFAGKTVFWLFVTFEFDEEAALAPLRDRPVDLGLEEMRLLSHIVDGQVAYRDELDDGSDASSLWAGLLLTHLLRQAGRTRPAADALPASPTLARIQKVLAWIGHRLHEPIDTAALARVAHLSEAHLRRVFARTMGVPLATYLRQARVNRAIGLLHRTEMSISAIADQCGASSIYSFSRTFRSVTGVSPSEYRRRILRGEAGGRAPEANAAPPSHSSRRETAPQARKRYSV